MQLQTERVETTSATAGARVRTAFKALIPFLGGGEAEAEVHGEAGHQHQLQWEFVGYNLGEAQAIAELLKKASFDRFVVLENFHYLKPDVQSSLAFDLKTFHELGIRFIILGIWQEANLLLYYNQDLQDRIDEIPVEPWSDEDFDRLITKGADLLQITVAENARASFKQSAYGNVGLLQEFLRLYCEKAAVLETCPEPRALENDAWRSGAISTKLKDQTGQLIRVLQSFAGKSRTRTDEDARGAPLILPYYLVHAILHMPIDAIRQGLLRRELQEHIRGVHHRQDGDSPRSSDMTNLLTRLPELQHEMGTPFLHYNSEEKRLRIVDMRHFFTLANIDRAEVWDEIPNPLRLDE